MNSGIYKIRNIVNNHFYIGSAINFKNRFRIHKHYLKMQKHPNIMLQRVYNKYGLEKLAFEIVETIEDKDNLIKREQYFIDTLNPKYNIARIAGSQLGFKHSKKTRKKMSDINKGKHLSFETRAKMSRALKDRKRGPVSEITKKKLSKLNKGKHLSEITKQKISKNSAKYWQGKHLSEEHILKISKPFKLLSPEGVVVEGINLKKFCRNNDLGYKGLHALLKNKLKSYKGWISLV